MSALSDIIANTPAGGTAALPAGEYEGPVVINKPLTLRGSSATVWSKHGSVIEVSSQGVTLEGLRVEITEGALSEPAITAKFPVNIRAVEVLPDSARRTASAVSRGRFSSGSFPRLRRTASL